MNKIIICWEYNPQHETTFDKKIVEAKIVEAIGNIAWAKAEPFAASERPLRCVWIVETGQSPADIREKLQGIDDRQHHFLVGEVDVKQDFGLGEGDVGSDLMC